MEAWLYIASRILVIAIDTMALIIIAVGTVEAFFRGLWAAFAAPASSGRVSAVWLRFDRWLVAALTFLLAADIIQTSVAPSWAEIGQVAAIAVIRTFLNYFLGRDMEELRRADAAPPRDAASEGNWNPSTDSVPVASSPTEEQIAANRATDSLGDFPAFHPVVMRGEPLSATVLRDRR